MISAALHLSVSVALVLTLLTCSSAATHTPAQSNARRVHHRAPSSSCCFGFASAPRSTTVCRSRGLKRAVQCWRTPLMAAAASGVEVTNVGDGTVPQQLVNADGFQLLLQKAVQTLVKSDTDGEELDHSYGSASQGLWLHAPAAREMQKLLDRVVLEFRAATQIGHISHGAEQRHLLASETSADYVPKVSIEDANDRNPLEPLFGNSTNVGAKNRTSPSPTEDAFGVLVQTALQTLIQSDIKRPDGSSSQGRWVYDPAARELQQVMDRLVIPQSQSMDSPPSLEDEQRNQWQQFMKTTPSPLFLDLTEHIRDRVMEAHDNGTPFVSDEHLEFVDMSLEQYISRIACHVIVLPSGSETAPLSLVESTGAYVYGKLLYGGVSRFRLLKSGKTVRRAGERREVMASNSRLHPSWVQVGGIERKYESLDIGPAAVLELTLLPRLWQDLPSVFDKSVLAGGARGDMTIPDASWWDPSLMLRLLPEEDEKEVTEVSESSDKSVFRSVEGGLGNDALTSHFQSRVGGLKPQIDAIVRRVLDGRDSEMEELSMLGLQPVRGLLLYGKPGVGKTLIVREISRLISIREPKIISAPEILDRWVGGSELNCRELFQDAEEELKFCKAASGAGNEERAFLNSALHVIVIDEIDAVFRKRIDSNDSGAITRNSVVNQLLAKLDGVNALPNVLMVGMTNRRELLDPALLRPGRLEVQIEIPLPDREGRREVLNIHFGALRARGRLSYPLRCAIDGVAPNDLEYGETPHEPMKGRKRRALKRAAANVVEFISTRTPGNIYDLAAETSGFSGADIEGLVRCAGSIALSRARQDGSGVESLLITLDDVKQALVEVKA